LAWSEPCTLDIQEYDQIFPAGGFHKFIGLWSYLQTQGLFTLERVGSNPKAQVVPGLGDESHWKWGTFPKVRKLEMSCGSNFRCKLKKKGHGPLSRWADFLSGVM
jgi:hypothetical protein